MTSRISRAYDAIKPLVPTEFLEPVGDVERVNELRQQFRPKTVKLLVLGESHVRRKAGPGFIYDAGYYTPWWHDLLWPTFGGRDRPRLQNLEALRDRGVWLLDMSVIALSGYRNVCPAWPARPFDALSSAIFQTSWTHFIQQEWEPLARVPLIYFERAAALLPETARRRGTPLRFNGPRPATCPRYADPAYPFGTARFIEAARAAGV